MKTHLTYLLVANFLLMAGNCFADLTFAYADAAPRVGITGTGFVDFPNSERVEGLDFDSATGDLWALSDSGGLYVARASNNYSEFESTHEFDWYTSGYSNFAIDGFTTVPEPSSGIALTYVLVGCLFFRRKRIHTLETINDHIGG